MTKMKEWKEFAVADVLLRGSPRRALRENGEA